MLQVLVCVLSKAGRGRCPRPRVRLSDLASAKTPEANERVLFCFLVALAQINPGHFVIWEASYRRPYFLLNNGAKRCVSCVCVSRECTAQTASCESCTSAGFVRSQLSCSQATNRVLCLCAFVRASCAWACLCLHDSRPTGGEVTQEAGGGARAADGGGETGGAAAGRQTGEAATDSETDQIK